MALTVDEEKRFQTVETKLAEHATAIKNLGSKRQLSQVLTLVQRQLDEIKLQITSIQTQLDALKK